MYIDMTELTDENFSKEVIDKGEKVIIDCWANWCGKCKMFKPLFEQAESKYKDYKFCTLDVDKAPKSATALNITNLPTIVIFDKTKEVKRGSFELLNEL